MRHPEALLLPVFMVTDYYLTVLGAIHREKGYTRHFRMEHYELNPVWQKDVAAKRWLNPRHLILTALTSVLIIVVMEGGVLLPAFDGAVATFNEMFLGAALSSFAIIIGRHINNLLVFRHLEACPHDLSGELTMTHGFALSTSLYQTVMVFVPLALVAGLSANTYATGGMIGSGALALAHLTWMRRARKSAGAGTAGSKVGTAGDAANAEADER